MSFTSMNGNVDVTLPATAKANLKMRTDHGGSYSDFEMLMRPNAPPAIQDTRSRGGRYRIESDRSISATINGGGADKNQQSFLWGRKYYEDAAWVESFLTAKTEPIAATVNYTAELTAYQNAGYARSFSEFVAEVTDLHLHLLDPRIGGSRQRHRCRHRCGPTGNCSWSGTNIRR